MLLEATEILIPTYRNSDVHMCGIVYCPQLSMSTSCQWLRILDVLSGVSHVCLSHTINDLVSERENHVDVVYPFSLQG